MDSDCTAQVVQGPPILPKQQDHAFNDTLSQDYSIDAGYLQDVGTNPSASQDSKDFDGEVCESEDHLPGTTGVSTSLTPEPDTTHPQGHNALLMPSHQPLGDKVNKMCDCMDCRSVGLLVPFTSSCRFPGCNTALASWHNAIHEKTHYRTHQHGSPHYGCIEQHCSFTTKRWPDLIRHYTVRHCTSPKKFPCPVPWCKFSGENGFARKDKLKSHHKNVHAGQSLFAQAQGLRAIQPALGGNQTAASGSSSGSSNGQERSG